MKKSSGSAAERRPDGMPKGKPFEPGQSGNPAGLPKGIRHSRTILRELLAVEQDIIDEITGETRKVNQLDIILLKLVKDAKNGNGFSIDRVLDRVEGKVEQTTKNVNLNVETNPAELESLTDDQIARMAAIAKESSNG